MQEWLDNNILIYFTHNKGKSVTAEKFMKTLKVNIYKKWQLMIANRIFLVWLLDECNAIYHHYVNKNPINRDYTAFSEKNWDRF